MADERIYVLCDRCGKPVPSGLIIDTDTLPQASQTFAENRTICPLCGNWIVWGNTKVWPASVVQQRYGKLPENQ